MKALLQPSKKNKNDRIFSLAWNIVYWLLKSHCFEFYRGGKYGLFWAKNLMEMWYLLITEKLFWTFRVWEIQSFLRQKVKEKMIFTDYWNVLVLNFSGMENTIFFEGKSWWKGDIFWLLKSSCSGIPKGFCFELFGYGKYGLFFS